MKRNLLHDDLYVLKNPLNQKIKIGRSKNAEQRIRNIITQGGLKELETLFIIKRCGDYESHFLKLFRNYNHIGEWHYNEQLLKLLIISLTYYEEKGVSLEDIIIRLSILENEFVNTEEFINLDSYRGIVNLTNPLYKSAAKILNIIINERKGIGWGVQTDLLDFVMSKKIEFRNYLYSINSLDSIKYELIRKAKFDVDNPPTPHIKIEMLRIKKNNARWKQKQKIQNEIDRIFSFEIY